MATWRIPGRGGAWWEVIYVVAQSRTRLKRLSSARPIQRSKGFIYISEKDSLVAQMVKSLPTVWETWVRSLGQEDPLEKAMATHSSTLAWKIPQTKEPGRLQSMGSLRVRIRLSVFTFTFHFHALEKELATHSSVLAWRIPGTEEPVECHQWGHTESEKTDASQQQQHSIQKFIIEHFH